MNKIDKIEKELEKAREKAAEWQAKIRDLEKQKQEEENSQIVQAVRSLKLTPAELMAFLSDPKNAFSASGQSGPKSEDTGKEENTHEENYIHEAGSSGGRPFELLHFPGSGLRPEQRAAGGNTPGAGGPGGNRSPAGNAEPVQH